MKFPKETLFTERINRLKKALLEGCILDYEMKNLQSLSLMETAYKMGYVVGREEQQKCPIEKK